jgi:hypothetical protein
MFTREEDAETRGISLCRMSVEEVLNIKFLFFLKKKKDIECAYDEQYNIFNALNELFMP